MNHKLPLKKDGSDMYEKMDDGILLCKVTMWMMYNGILLFGVMIIKVVMVMVTMNICYNQIINLAAPDTIDERAINKGKEVQIFRQHENLTLARNSARWHIQQSI